MDGSGRTIRSALSTLRCATNPLTGCSTPVRIGSIRPVVASVHIGTVGGPHFGPTALLSGLPYRDRSYLRRSFHGPPKAKKPRAPAGGIFARPRSPLPG